MTVVEKKSLYLKNRVCLFFHFVFYPFIVFHATDQNLLAYSQLNKKKPFQYCLHVFAKYEIKYRLALSFKTSSFLHFIQSLPENFLLLVKFVPSLYSAGGFGGAFSPFARHLAIFYLCFLFSL